MEITKQGKCIKCAAILTVLSVATACFDELLVFEFHNITIRYSQIFTIFAIAFLFLNFIWQKKVFLPIGWEYLLVLLFLNFLLSFFTTSESLLYQLGYQVWFMLDIALVILCINVFSEKEKYIRLYIGIYVFMACVCILQVIFGLCGLSFYQYQWFGVFPRGDAFLSEPSYYASFALPGWIFLSYEVEQQKINILKKSHAILFWGVVTLSILFSTSRMGILMMIVWMFFRIANCIRASLHKTCMIRLLKMTLFLVLMVAFLQFFYAAVNANHDKKIDDVPNQPPYLEENEKNEKNEENNIQKDQAGNYIKRLVDFSGSDMPRISGMLATFETFFKKHLIIGSSLGGVYAEVMSMTSYAWQVVNLFAELSVAFGIPGMIILICYSIKVTKKVIACADENPIICALFWGLVWQVGILQFNNNGLRIYLWVNIATLSMFLSKTELKLERKEGN